MLRRQVLASTKLFRAKTLNKSVVQRVKFLSSSHLNEANEKKPRLHDLVKK